MGSWHLALLRVVDPAEAHFRRVRRGRTGTAAVPPVPGAGNGADVLAVDGIDLAQHANALLRRDIITLRLPDHAGFVVGRVLTFWRGDHVVEVIRHDPAGGSDRLLRSRVRRQDDGAVDHVEEMLRTALRG